MACATPVITMAETDYPQYDVLIIGAGLSGLYSLHKIRQLGLRARVLEAASDVGGTWFWNRYPGARFDSESYSYNFFFSQEILDEWDWTEHFASQPETLRYINFVCNKLDLKSDIQLETRVQSAHWQAKAKCWLLTDDVGRRYSSRFLITAMGILNAHTLPDIPGVNDFQGESFHTARWPIDGVTFEGKRVAVIGTGATGIQTIQEVAKTARHLTVLQRTPNWSAPLRNDKITSEGMQSIRASYPKYQQQCLDSYACFIHTSDPRSIFDVTIEERESLWETLYQSRGFGKWLSNFWDVNIDEKANALASDFFARKIRERVYNPTTAETLIPKCHGFGTRRVPLENGYYETYNQENVTLKDIKKDPIRRITRDGVQTQDQHLKFDVIIYATGFDAVTGSFMAIDFRGVNNLQLNQLWADDPSTFLGMFVHGFPNMLMVMGPHQVFGNIPRSIEFAVDWISNFIDFCVSQGIVYADASDEATTGWMAHLATAAPAMLMDEVDSWLTSTNANVNQRRKRRVLRYRGAAPEYRRRAQEVANSMYQGLVLEG